MGVSLKDINWAIQKKLSREYGNLNEKKASTFLTNQIVQDIIDNNREIYLSNPIIYERNQRIKGLKKKLEEKGFFELIKVKALNQDGQIKLIEQINDNKMPYGFALFDFLGFLHKLDIDLGLNKSTNKIGSSTMTM